MTTSPHCVQTICAERNLQSKTHDYILCPVDIDSKASTICSSKLIIATIFRIPCEFSQLLKSIYADLSFVFYPKASSPDASCFRIKDSDNMIRSADGCRKFCHHKQLFLLHKEPCTIRRGAITSISAADAHRIPRMASVVAISP